MSKGTYTIKMVDNGNFIRILGLSVSQVYLSSRYLCVLHLLNQTPCHVGVVVSYKTEAAAGSCQRIAHNLGFFYLTVLLKMALKIVVRQLIVQAANEDFVLHATERLLVISFGTLTALTMLVA